MGAWSEGVFDNDVAGDWCDQFEKNPASSVVGKPILQLAKARRPSDELCMTALVAAEIIAASRGNGCRDFPEELQRWIQFRSYQADDELAGLAAKCVERIAENSELADLWEHQASWKKGLRNLQQRLVAPLKVVRTAKSTLTSRSTSSKKQSFATAKKEVDRISGCFLARRKSGEISLSLSDTMEEKRFIQLLQKYQDVFAAIETLVLNFEFVTDESLGELCKLPHLQTLFLDHSSISDAGMKMLATFPALKFLSIVSTRVSNVGLMQLAGSRLVCLAINKTRITDSGLAQFRALTPECFIGPSYEWSTHRAKHQS
ncbi:MAG: DUF4259 domain-containing protein [Planctomyces sp.]|nr:DUF4259 domain-containing protein [Planctomyces sp.]